MPHIFFLGQNYVLAIQNLSVLITGIWSFLHICAKFQHVTRDSEAAATQNGVYQWYSLQTTCCNCGSRNSSEYSQSFVWSLWQACCWHEHCWSLTRRVKALGRGLTEQLAKTVSPDMLHCADAVIREDQGIISQQLVLKLSVNKGNVNAIINVFGYSKLCASWVPWSLTVEQKSQRKGICFELLVHFEAEGEGFLSRIIT